MTKAEFLSLAEARYDSLQALSGQSDFYAYESDFEKIWTDLGRAVLEKSLGAVPADHRKKTKYAAATVPCK